MGYVDIKTSATDLTGLQVSGNGRKLDCKPDPKDPARLICAGAALAPSQGGMVTICGPECPSISTEGGEVTPFEPACLQAYALSMTNWESSPNLQAYTPPEDTGTGDEQNTPCVLALRADTPEDQQACIDRGWVWVEGAGCLPGPDEEGNCPLVYYNDTGADACAPVGGPYPCVYGYSIDTTQFEQCYRDCLPGFIYDTQSQCCKPKSGGRYPNCFPGWYPDPESNSCIPGDGKYPWCPKCFYYDGQTCVPDVSECPEVNCPEDGTYYDPYNRLRCTDIPGLDEGQPDCGEAMYFDVGYNTCLPIPGGPLNPHCPRLMYFDGKTCQPFQEGEQPECDEDWTFTGSNCTPPAGSSLGPNCISAFVYIPDCYGAQGAQPGVVPTACSQYKNKDKCVSAGCTWDPAQGCF
jgi:hypothetical protein